MRKHNETNLKQTPQPRGLARTLGCQNNHFRANSNRSNTDMNSMLDNALNKNVPTVGAGETDNMHCVSKRSHNNHNDGVNIWSIGDKNKQTSTQVSSKPSKSQASCVQKALKVITDLEDGKKSFLEIRKRAMEMQDLEKYDNAEKNIHRIDQLIIKAKAMLENAGKPAICTTPLITRTNSETRYETNRYLRLVKISGGM
jgi:hypothetical protein